MSESGRGTERGARQGSLRAALGGTLGCAGVCNLDGKVFVVGGWNGQRGLTCCDVFDPLTKTWCGVAPMQLGEEL